MWVASAALKERQIPKVENSQVYYELNQANLKQMGRLINLVICESIYAVCPGGEGAVLKTVGLKGLAGSNPVHGAIYRGITQRLEWGAYISLVVGSNPTSPTKVIMPCENEKLKLFRFETKLKVNGNVFSK